MERCKKINDLVMILKNDIIRDLIESHLNQSKHASKDRSEIVTENQRKNINFKIIIKKI